MSRALVIGGSGQIGGWLLHWLAERGRAAVGTYATVPMPGMRHLDAGDEQAVAAALDEIRPSLVFYPAGFTWVDGCEHQPRRALAENVVQPMRVARAARDRGARFVYFSTDYVFNGADGPNGEQDPTKPLSVYGQAKRYAEVGLISELKEHALILRTSWVFGPERQGKNFAYQLLAKLKAGEPIVVPSDQRSSPGYGPDVARVAVELAEEGVSGLCHVVGPETMPRPEFAAAIARAFGLDESLIVAKPTAELGQVADRPLRGGLRADWLDEHRPGAMRPLAEALADFRDRVRAPSAWKDPLA